MPEPQRSRRAALAAGLVGIVLAVLAGLGGIIALLAGWLAQPAFALALRWRDGRDPAMPRPREWQAETLGLAVSWGLGLLLAGALIAWPLSALRQSGALGAAVALSVAAGVCLIGLWRTWPAWYALERESTSLTQAWQRLAETETGAWRGLGVATLIATVLATVLLLAWPSLLTPAARWVVAAVCVVLWPALHWALQRIQPPALAAVDFDEFEPAHASDADPADDADPVAALYAAALGGRVDRALALLDADVDAHAAPPADARDQRTLPVLAAVLPDLRLLRALIARGVDLNAAHAGMTPLLAATRDSWHGRPEAVMTLLANGADPRAVDAEGNTPLHHAARSSDPGVAALLRDAAAEINVLNDEGVSPLGIACAAGNWRLARFLLERGAHPQPEAATPALLSAAGGDEDDAAGVLLLLKHKAKVDARDAQGRTALHEAAFAGHVEIIAALLAAGADVDAHDSLGRTPWLDAARGGRLVALEVLATARSRIGAIDHSGQGALALACAADLPTPALVLRLLALGADPGQRDQGDKRAIDVAAEAGRWALVSALDPGYALPQNVANDDEDATLPDRPPLSLLREGLQEARLEQIDKLVPLLSPGELGSLLVEPDASLSPVAIDWLLARGADAETRTGFDDNAMFVLLAHGPDALDGLNAMLRHGVSPAGSGGLARFLGACAHGDQAARGLERFALELLERGADPYAVSHATPKAGDPPLALAVRLGWMQLLERLVIGHGVDLETRDSHGMTALHLAAALGREPAVKLLVAQGASPTTCAADGQTPLGVALAGGRRDLADWLDWRGWPLPGRALQASDVPAAAIVGDVDAVRRLLDLGLPIDTVDSQGCSALLRAAGGGHRTTVDLLLARGADPQRAAHTGATPLSAAVSMRQGEIVDCLLAAGATLEQRLPGDVTVLMLAAALGLPDLCARLLIAGANVHAQDAQGLTPLHCATLYGFGARERPRLMALLDTLLLAGADADAAAAGNVTPLLLLLGARAEPGSACDEEVVLTGLERLLDEEVALDVQDPRGFGPLHLAALHGLLRITQRLLRTGADPDLRDALNRPPREIAVMRGFVDVAAQFAPQPSGVSMARFLREPR